MRSGAGQATVFIRWSDIDALGHVNHAVFLNYLEEVRDTWLTSASEGRIARHEVVLARVEIDYLRPVSLEEGKLVGDCRLISVGNKSLRTRETLSRASGDAVVRAESTLVMWDPETSQSRAITEGEHDLLSRHVDPGDP
jgi:acyl-CoA thioester hydrolase